MKKKFLAIGAVILVVIAVFTSCVGSVESPDSEAISTTQLSENTSELTNEASENESSTDVETTTEEVVTEAPTERATQKPTEKATQKPTQKMTQKPTEKQTEKITEKITEKKTENQTKADGRTVYITANGERYHFDPDCPGKNGYAVSIDNVGGRTACKKCAQ